MGGIERARLFSEWLARKTANGTIGQATDEPEDNKLADMNITVGDQTHNYPQPPRLGTLAKLGLAAALIGSGAGATLGIPLAISALTAPTPPVVESPADEDTRYELRLDVEDG